MFDERSQLLGLANAFTIFSAMLVDELDKRGALSKAEFGKLLLDSAASAEANAAPDLRVKPRYDLFLLRNIVSNLDLPAGPSWTPTVIEGDKED